jgi:hypothetical protein
VTFKIHWDSARTYSVGNRCLRLTVAIQLYRGISYAGHLAVQGIQLNMGFQLSKGFPGAIGVIWMSISKGLRSL